MAFLTQEVFGYKLIEMFYTITGSMWNRTKGTQLPEAVQTTAEFLPGEGARREGRECFTTQPCDKQT